MKEKKANRKKEVLNIRTEITEIENRENQSNQNWFFQSIKENG